MRLKKKIRITKNLLEYLILKKKKPFWVDLKLTNRCNLRCKYCGIWERKVKEMSTKDVFKLVDEVEKDCAVISLNGGEPLLRDDIDAIVDYIKKKDGILLCLWTNGILLDKHIQAAKKTDFIGLSMDGPKKIHDMLRGKGSFDKVLEAVDILKKNKVPFYVNMTLNRYNVYYVDWFIEKSRELGFLCNFQPIVVYGQASKDVESLVVPAQRFNKAIRLIISKKRFGTIINTRKSLKMFLDMKNLSISKCRAGYACCHINPDGDVYRCPIDVTKYKAQNCVTKGFKQAFENLPIFPCKGCNSSTYNDLNFSSFGDFIHLWVRSFFKHNRQKIFQNI